MATILKFPPKSPDYLLNKQMDLYIMADRILVEAVKTHKKSLEVIATALKAQADLIKMMASKDIKH